MTHVISLFAGAAGLFCLLILGATNFSARSTEMPQQVQELYDDVIGVYRSPMSAPAGKGQPCDDIVGKGECGYINSEPQDDGFNNSWMSEAYQGLTEAPVASNASNASNASSGNSSNSSSANATATPTFAPLNFAAFYVPYFCFPFGHCRDTWHGRTTIGDYISRQMQDVHPHHLTAAETEALIKKAAALRLLRRGKRVSRAEQNHQVQRWVSGKSATLLTPPSVPRTHGSVAAFRKSLHDSATASNLQHRDDLHGGRAPSVFLSATADTSRHRASASRTATAGASRRHAFITAEEGIHKLFEQAKAISQGGQR